MNKIHKRGRCLPRRNDSFNMKFKPGVKIKSSDPIEVLLSAPIIPRSEKKNVADRCCYVSPIIEDFAQHYTGESPNISKDSEQVKYRRHDPNEIHSLVKDQHGYEPVEKISTTHRKKPKQVSCDTYKWGKTSSQHNRQASDKPSLYAAEYDGKYWLKVDSSEEVEKFLSKSDDTSIRSSKHIFISKAPRVKVIAEKFSKYKRGNLELRRLEEKVVCVEYDIFWKSSNDVLKPTQKMRAFFSIKPSVNESSEKQELPGVPENIKNEFEILDDHLQKLTDKEIEFIDEKIAENKSYLEDIRRILKRKKVINAQKNKTSLDLQSLYEMAIRERPPLNDDLSGANLLSKAELEEVKELILQRCTSSIRGFRRRKIKQNEQGLAPDVGVISESMMADLLAITKNLGV